MKDLDPLVFFAVIQEMLGPTLWLLIGVAAIGITMFLIVIARERRIISPRLLLAEVFGVGGGICALIFMAWVTHSGFTDAGGPIDWLLIGVIFGAGMIGATLLAYAVMGFCGYFCHRQTV